MKQNNFMIRMIGAKEKVYNFYQKRGRILAPILRAILMVLLLFLINRMFPYNNVAQKIYVLAAAGLLQAFLPLSFLFYIVSAFILAHLWTISFDIFIAFFLLIFICAIGYFRISNKFSYVSIIVAVLFFCKLEFMIPAALAMAIGVEALFPSAIGVILYFLSFYLKESSLVISSDSSALGVGLQYLVQEILENQTFLLMLFSICLAILVTSLLRKLFYERAWILAATLGNAATACLVLVGHIFLDTSIDTWRVILEAILGVLVCILIEFFRGIGDVSRIERTVFEDEEYIYYVKAVPKIKVAKEEPNYMNMNEIVMEEEAAQSEEEDLESSAGDELEDVQDMTEASEENV